MGFKKYGKRFKQTIVSLLALLLVFSGVAPSTALQTVHAETALTINGTDSYGAAFDGTKIYQFDGTNPSATPKASVDVKGITMDPNLGLNGLAVDKNNNVFYASTGEQLYLINPDGTGKLVTNLFAHAGNGIISEDGKYYYSYGKDGKIFLASYDLVTGKHNSTEIKNSSSFGLTGNLGGDLLLDGDGYIWFATGTNIIQMDPTTATILRTVPIENPSNGPSGGFVGARGLSFLPNGQILMASGPSYNEAILYLLDPKTLKISYFGTMPGKLMYDLASAVTPVFQPKLPVLESKKEASIQQKAEGNTNAAHPEVGDTLLYTIQTRNTVQNSLVTNLTISDTIPAGLEYIPGTLKVDGTAVTDVQGDDNGHYADGKVDGQFGNVTNTEWHTVTFQTKVMPGQAGKVIQNTAKVTGTNITTPQEPTTKVDVYPKDSKLESEKSAKNLQDKPIAVGDEIEYTIKMRNTISDSLIKNAVIEDQLPAGLEYVPGTLQVDGKAVTDAEGDDNGHYIQGKVTGKLGDITDIEWHSVTFHAKVKADQAGKTIQNKATVTGDGITPQEPTTTVEVSTPETPTPPANSCGQLGRVALVNGSFEQPYYTSIAVPGPGYFTTPAGTVPGWKTTDSYQVFEIFNKTLMDQIQPGSVQDKQGLKNSVAHGEQFAELNSREAAQLYQDVQTTPGQTIYWRLAHKGRLGTDTMALKIGSSAVHPKDLPTVQQMTTGKDQWKYYTGTYKVPAGQTVTRFGFEAVSSAGGNPAAGNFLDDIFLGTEPCVSATKSLSPEGQVKSGDELTYNVTVKNDGGDIAANSIFTDAIPAGTEYVPGSIQVIKNGQASTVTDGKDTDSGDYLDGKVTVNLGDLPNTDILPDGVTVQFKVKVLSGYVNQQIKNKANVAYKNLLTNRDGTVDTNEVVNTVILKEAKVESKKIAKNLQDKNTEVGDEIEYTIQMRNTVSDSIVKNAVIEDQLPEGLEYVPGTLQVNGKPVTDTEGDDTGHYVQGKFTGQLGDITDTEWHTVVFHAKVKAGQAGQDIQNTAKVTGENVPPQEPSTTVEVYPRNPKVESKKTAKNLQDKNIEVGDEIEYTIQMRNTVSDSLVKNAVIEDQLPEALEYVPGTLQVNGQAVTDAEGDDNGHYVQGKVTGKLGDITDTEWHTVVFHAKVKAGNEGTAIQNTATVTGDDITPQEPTTEIKVQPLGQIEIEKVDAADSTIKLKNAVFQIIDKDGKEVGKLTTDENGKATSELLLLGKYTVKEIKAPDGYMLLKDPIEVEVSSPLQKITVENTKNGWNIPHTGGIGTTLFYLIGIIIMVAALVVFFRKRAKNK